MVVIIAHVLLARMSLGDDRGHGGGHALSELVLGEDGRPAKLQCCRDISIDIGNDSSKSSYSQ
jgi:hypothetical protein